jgi:hypothetical protein
MICVVLAIASPLPAQRRSQASPSPVYVFGQADFPAINNGSAVARGDFNGDGRPDLAAISTQNNSVSILLGQPDGSLLDTGVSYAVVSPRAIAVGDFNGDGKLDLAVVNFICPPNNPSCPPGSVSVLLGNGDGTFRPRADYATGPAPLAIAVGDFTGNGKLDLAVANHVNPIDSASPGTVSILLGNGDGTFQPHSDFPAGLGVGSVVTADFSNDGKLDLVVVNSPAVSSNTVGLLLGNGDGTFQSPTNLTVGGLPTALAAGDFNHDGNMDLAVTADGSPSGSVVSILLGNGNGTFQPHVDYAVAFGTVTVMATDFNADGKLDLIVGAYGLSQGGIVSVLFGNGDGTFQPHSDYTVGSPRLIAVQDFNGDGKLDVALSGTPGARIVLGNGNGTLGQAVQYSTGAVPIAVAVADFNNDGKPDLAVVNLNCAATPCSNSSVSILLGDGEGTFAPHMDFAVGHRPSAVAVGDFNGDGKQDLALANAGDGTVSILLGNGDGTFQTAVPPAVGNNPQAIVAADFNGDGKLDLAVCNFNDNSVSILLGKGDGTFQAQVAYPTALGPTALVASEFNGDGKLDLAVADAQTVGLQNLGLVSVLLDNGDGTFQNHSDTQLGLMVTPVTLVAGDFNHDGKMDLAVTATPDGELGFGYILLGNGDGSFLITPGGFGLGSISFGIAAADFGATGNLGLAATWLSRNSVGLLKGNGDGTFQTQSVYGTGSAPVGVALADLNADSLADMIVANSLSNTVSVFVSRPGSAPDFALFGAPPSQTIQSGQQATYALTIAPINGYSQTIGLTCSGNPSGSTCTVSPSSISLNGSMAASGTVTVVPAAAATAPLVGTDASLPLVWCGLVAALSLVHFVPRRRSGQRASTLCFAALLVVTMLVTIPSCGGGGSGGGHSGPPPGTYTLTVTGTSGSIQHTMSFTLSIR